MNHPKDTPEDIKQLREECQRFLQLTDEPQFRLRTWWIVVGMTLRKINKATNLDYSGLDRM